MRCDMVVPVSGMRQACVGHASGMGHSLGQGVCWFPSGFAITAVSSRAGRSGFSRGEKHKKLLAFDLYQLRNRSHVTESVP
jgi:hypothetical protein